VAAPIWERFMERALENEPILDFAVPPDVSFVLINKHTGQRSFPGDEAALLECFHRGTEPPAVVAQPVQALPAASDTDSDFFRDVD
jgi:membrane carboxypeptidase/penicillin-binding protein